MFFNQLPTNLMAPCDGQLSTVASHYCDDKEKGHPDYWAAFVSKVVEMS